MITRQQIPDIIRGIAIFGVVTVHAGGTFFEPASNSGPYSMLALGRFGVELFFVLSGFLVAGIYEQSNQPATQFWIRRFFRLWPVWALACLAWALYDLASGVDPQRVIIQLGFSLFFLLWLLPASFSDFIVGGWSINIEIVSYLLFSILKGRSTATLLGVAVVINLFGLASYFVGQQENVYGFFQIVNNLTLHSGFNFFLIGWVASRVAATGIQQLVAEFFDGRNLLANRFLVLSVWFISFIITPAKYGAPIEALAFVLAFTLLSIWLPAWTLLASLLAWIGRHSYFIFLFHYLMLRGLGDFLTISNRTNIGVGPAEYLGLSALLIAIVFLVSSVGAWLSMRFFEGPLNDLGRQRNA